MKKSQSAYIDVDWDSLIMVLLLPERLGGLGKTKKEVLSYTLPQIKLLSDVLAENKDENIVGENGIATNVEIMKKMQEEYRDKLKEKEKEKENGS